MLEQVHHHWAAAACSQFTAGPPSLNRHALRSVGLDVWRSRDGRLPRARNRLYFFTVSVIMPRRLDVTLNI